LKKQADLIKKELDHTTAEINAVDGIKIVVNGAQNFQSLEIDETLVREGNKQQLEADLLHSLNAAIKESQVLAAQKMKAIMPGLPGM